MPNAKSQEIARQAKLVYENRLKLELEAHHRDRYAAIEPESGDYFLGETMREAIDAARNAHPDRISFVLRIGHPAAFHIGGGWNDRPGG